MGFNAPIYDEKLNPVESASWDVGTNAHAKWFQIECRCPGVMPSLFACVDIVFDGDWESLTKLMCLFSKIERNFVAAPCHACTGVCNSIDRCERRRCLHTHRRKKRHSSGRPANRSIRQNAKCHYSIAMVCEPLVDDIYSLHSPKLRPILMLAKARAAVTVVWP